MNIKPTLLTILLSNAAVAQEVMTPTKLHGSVDDPLPPPVTSGTLSQDANCVVVFGQESQYEDCDPYVVCYCTNHYGCYRDSYCDACSNCDGCSNGSNPLGSQIGERSCVGVSDCTGGTFGRIGRDSCRKQNMSDRYLCYLYNNDGAYPIGERSCACEYAVNYIGHDSCRGEKACKMWYPNQHGTRVTIGNNACFGPRACEVTSAENAPTQDIPDNCPSIAALNEGLCGCGSAGCYCGDPHDDYVDNGVCVDNEFGGACILGICRDFPDPNSCMAGNTGFVKVEKALGSVINSGVVALQDLEVGDRIMGLDESKTSSDECEVVSVASKGMMTVFGNYTSDHYVLTQNDELVEHGPVGNEEVTEVFQVLSSCPLAIDESGKKTTFSMCGQILYAGGQMPWSVYLKVHSTMVNLIKSTGVRSLSAFYDINYANEHLPDLCRTGLTCSDTGDCVEFEEKILAFASRELVPDAREKVFKAFPSLGEASKVGSVSHLISKGKSSDFLSGEVVSTLLK